MAYFPNGTSGEVFAEQCSRCRYGQGSCPIWNIQQEFNYKACNNKVASAIMDKLVLNDGTCMVFIMAEEFFDVDHVPENTAERAYLELTADTPKNIRELVLKAANRIA
jgi:hypothetical protein